MKLRKAKKTDLSQLIRLYKAAAKTDNGIARKPAEINQNFVKDFLQNSLKKGTTVRLST